MRGRTTRPHPGLEKGYNLMEKCVICRGVVRDDDDAADVHLASKEQELANGSVKYEDLEWGKEAGLAHAECFGDQTLWVMS